MTRIRHDRSLHFGASVVCALLLAFTFVPGMAAQIPERTPEETPAETLDDAEQFQARPIARGWKIAGALLVVSAAGVGLYFAIRSWRFSNMFDRQYVFPPAKEASLRLGGGRSGGCMATIAIAAPTETGPVTPQTPEETPPP